MSMTKEQALAMVKKALPGAVWRQCSRNYPTEMQAKVGGLVVTGGVYEAGGGRNKQVYLFNVRPNEGPGHWTATPLTAGELRAFIRRRIKLLAALKAALGEA